MMLPRSSALRSNTLSPGIVWPPSSMAPRHGTLRRRISRISRGGWDGIRPVHGVRQPAGAERGGGVRRIARPDEGGGGTRLRRRLARRNPFPEGSVGTCVASGDRRRAGGVHPTRQNWHRRSGPSAEPPLRLAEDVATVDHVSKGRLEFGVGRSGLPGHYQGFNIPYSESRDRFLETLDILTKAWTQERFSHQGKYFQFQDVCIMPKPFQKPHPPIRIAATTPETYPLVGQLGRPVFVAVRTVSLADLKRHLPTYQTAWTASGHAGRGDVGVSVPLYVAETARQAREG